MKSHGRLRLIAAAMFFGMFTPAAPVAAQAVEPPPLSAYGELPGIEDAALSPSGERYAALLTIDGKRMLATFEADNKVISTTSVDQMKVRNFEWVGEDRVLLRYSVTEDLGYGFTTDKQEFFYAVVIPINKKSEVATIFNNRRDIVDAVFGNYGIRKIDGRWYGFFGAVELRKISRREFGLNHGRPFLHRVDLQDYSTQRIAPAARAGFDNDWLVDANGDVAATFTMNDENGRWTIDNASGDKIAEGRSRSGRGGLIGLGTGGQSVIYLERDEENATHWYEVSLGGGTPELFLDNLDVERLYFDRATGYLSGYLLEGENPKPVFDNAEMARAVRKVQAAFKNYDMRMVDWSNDLSHVIVRTTGVKDSGSWYTVDVKNLAANAFAYERMAIAPNHVGHFSTFEYTASDGMELDGILTIPPGMEPKNLPLVMLPHGGPHSSDRERFNWWAQAFASRGYAVFQPNFRGSTNRDDEFRLAGYGEWGRKMQTDKSDGLNALAEAGIIDPDRACIVGASYGGYAALAGVTLQQGIYKCAVAVAPVTDIRRMYREDYQASGSQKTTRVALREQLGDPEIWDAVSPERFAERADAPILLIHGRDDTVVPYEHSRKMADSLKDEKKPFEMLTLDGEDHWLSLSVTRQKMLAASLAFVQKHNPAD
ncbi:MAG: alpha/beta fold hydrolase [Erythrobacter sp.]